MMTTTQKTARIVGLALLAVGIASSAGAWARQGTAHRGHAGGGGHRVGAPAYRGGTAMRTAPARGHVATRGTATRTTATRATATRGTASGVARYGYGSGFHHGGGGWYGYPYWGGWYPWWSAGWYDGWGWDPYWYGYPGYGPWYAGDVETGTPSTVAPQGPAIIETGVSPAKAEVVLDGEMVGFASDYSGRWDQLSVASGPHTIAFRAKGYRTLVVELDARAGATYAFHDTLAPGDGEERRTLTMAEPAGPQETSSPAPASVATGRLRIHAGPADAAVYLDGEYLGLAGDLARIHGSLAVTTGTHRLELVRPGYASAVRTFDVDGTDPASVELRLEPER